MAYKLKDTNRAEDGELSLAPDDIPAEKRSSVSLLSNQLCSESSLPILAAQCLRELDTYRQGEPCADIYGLELLRRAIKQSDQEAWTWVKHCFGGMVREWLRRHPQREVACRLESEENYVAQEFERFWQATALNQWVEFSTLAAALQYLRASLHGLSWICCGHMRDHEKSRCQGRERQEIHRWKIVQITARSGISYN